jgi:hypothetical protein
MYERPRILSASDCFIVCIAREHVDNLDDDLLTSGFDVNGMERTFNQGDPLTPVAHEEIAQIELPAATDKDALERFVRAWHPARRNDGWHPHPRSPAGVLSRL